MALIRQHYVDFGPMLAREKLLERHDVHVGRETLRKWMAAAGIWLPRRERVRRAHQLRLTEAGSELGPHARLDAESTAPRVLV